MIKKITKLLMSLTIISIVSGTVFILIAPQPSFAATDPCNSTFLTFPTWFRGLTEVKSVNGVDKCNIKTPNDAGGLSGFIWRIVLNVIEIGLQLVGYVASFLILFGGFKFLTSSGDSSAVEESRKTIANASIGLIISIASIAIVNLIIGITNGTNDIAKLGDENIDIPKLAANTVLQNGLNIFYYIVGSLAVIMIIKAGFSYITSGGDSAAVTKAKNTILYSVIGLIVVIIAFSITAFITGSFATS